jgi:hypothetical protein
LKCIYTDGHQRQPKHLESPRGRVRVSIIAIYAAYYLLLSIMKDGDEEEEEGSIRSGDDETKDESSDSEELEYESSPDKMGRSFLSSEVEEENGA